jgi:signal transduction histidine kinase
MNFAVDDRYFYATIDMMENGNFMKSLLTSNEPAYIRHYNSIFEELWKNGVEAAQRIKDIEEGVDLADIEVIPSSARTQDLYLDIVKTASEEILWIFPTANAFIRQDKIGAIQLAKQAAKERNVKIRILVPTNSLIEQKLQRLKENCPDYALEFRYIEQMTETKATILVVDRKASLVMELRDDSKTTFVEAIGLSTYSNSKAGVSSYVAIFENLWVQSDLYEKLKINDKMQKEFIHIAAHELRTPIQPILGLTQVLYNKIKDSEHVELLTVVINNARRLQRLTEDILDVTKIESQSLNLRKEKLNLNDMVAMALEDYKDEIGKTNGKLKLVYEDKENDNTLIVEADKNRLFQVLGNLLTNAFKFTKEGAISVSIEKKDTYAIVSIKDTGTGIDPEIFPRLFTKFATKSVTGTGLGLYISKGIIEAHDGRIWAENNADGKGATFYFRLWLSKQ